MTRIWIAAFLLVAPVAAADPPPAAPPRPDIRPLPNPTIWCGTWLDFHSPPVGPRIEHLGDPPPSGIAEGVVLALEDVMDGKLKLKTELKPKKQKKTKMKVTIPRRRCLWCR
jgi:hypothetical protein